MAARPSVNVRFSSVKLTTCVPLMDADTVLLTNEIERRSQVPMLAANSVLP